MPELYTIQRQPLAREWQGRSSNGYDVVVIGSGYGGAITAARIATARWPQGQKPSVCVLERGKEWLPGQFPDKVDKGIAEARNSNNPLGLYDYRLGNDIGVIQASGLGGTSLINANVALRPDPELFDKSEWPQAIRNAHATGLLGNLMQRVVTTLNAGKHPRGNDLMKVKRLKQGAPASSRFELLDIAVNFEFEEEDNPWGVPQRRCINCGDCFTGCNVGAKNTLDTNYLALARTGGAHLFTQVEADWIEKESNGPGYIIHYKRRDGSGTEEGTLAARMVVVAAGSPGSAEILLRSREKGLSVSGALGTRFSGNGDYLGLAYNNDARVDSLGWGAHPDSDRALRLQPAPGDPLYPGPTIVSRVHYNTDSPISERYTVEDASVPSMYVDAARGLFAAGFGRDTDPHDFVDNFREFGRRLRDFLGLDPRLEGGALNHTLMYLVMGHDDLAEDPIPATGTISLDSSTKEAQISWPKVGKKKLFQAINDKLTDHTTVLGGSYVENPIWEFTLSRTLVTVHPLGGCAMGDDPAKAVTNHAGQVFDQQGGLHPGLLVADASVVPTAVGVNPFLTISALAELIAEGMIKRDGGHSVA